MKKAIIITIVLIILGIAGYFIFNLNDKKQFAENTANGIQAIPYNSIAILRLQEPLEIWEELSKSNYGKNLLKIPEFATISNDIKALESIIGRQNIFEKILKNAPVYLSLHMTGVKTFSYLGVSSIDPLEKTNFINAITKEVSHTLKTNRKYEEINITDFELTEKGKTLSVAFNGNLVIISNSPILIDESILQQKHRVSLSKHKSFSKLFNTADANVDANLFVNYAELEKLINIYGNEVYIKKAQISHIGNWMEVDLKINQDGISMNGFSLIDDSASTFFSSYSGQKAPKINVTSILPDNTAFLSYSGFSNYSKLLDGSKKHLQQRQLLFTYEKNCEDLEKKYGINLKEDFYSWIGKESCFFITQGKQKNPYKNACVAIQANDIEIAGEKLKKIQDKINPKAGAETYLKYTINNLGVSNFLAHTLGNSVIESQNSYFTIIQDYVVFANEIAVLKSIIKSYTTGKTLIKNVDYNQFYENFSDESSYFVYLNPKKASNFWEYFFNPILAEIFKSNQKTIDLFEAIGFQTVANENLFFTNLYSNFKIIKENKKVRMLDCALDTSCSQTPWIVINHYTKEKELFVQDDNNTVYLINNVGKILWKKQLRGKIIGDVHMIDKYKNNKFQYLFGTGTQLQLIDRNGVNVVGFPVQLKTPQTQGIGIADFDNNKDYRIFVPCDNKIVNYNKEGKVVSGFNFKTNKDKIANAPLYLNADGKDYMVFSDFSGKVYAINRRGENKINLKNTLPANRKKQEIIIGNNLSNSGIITTDSKGTLVYLKLNDKKEIIVNQSLSADHLFNTGNVSSSKTKDVLFYDQEKLSVYSLTKSKVFEISDLDFKPSFGLQTFPLNSSNNVIAITDKEALKIYLFEQNGQLIDGFPMEGSTPVLIDDLNNDGSSNLIFGNESGALFIYSEF